MAFGNRPLSNPTPRRPKDGPVFCVGWRVVVDWPPRAPHTSGPVPATDAEGKPLTNDLADGERVEILSWRPRSRDGVRYQVRRLTDGSEWWIAPRCLRRETAADKTADAGAARE